MTREEKIAKYGLGPWLDEDDHVLFEHEGFPCIIHRFETHGALCGYVAVPPGHPMHGKDYGDVAVDVHGGLTYAESCQGEICHVAKPGEPDDVWWFGFDTVHSGDLAPGHMNTMLQMRGLLDGMFNDLGARGATDVYRDQAYVTEQVKSLAGQLKAMS